MWVCVGGVCARARARVCVCGGGARLRRHREHLDVGCCSVVRAHVHCKKAMAPAVDASHSSLLRCTGGTTTSGKHRRRRPLCAHAHVRPAYLVRQILPSAQLVIFWVKRACPSRLLTVGGAPVPSALRAGHSRPWAGRGAGCGRRGGSRGAPRPALVPAPRSLPELRVPSWLADLVCVAPPSASLQVPHFWLVGYDENRHPLTHAQARARARGAAILPPGLPTVCTCTPCTMRPSRLPPPSLPGLTPDTPRPLFHARPPGAGGREPGPRTQNGDHGGAPARPCRRARRLHPPLPPCGGARTGGGALRCSACTPPAAVLWLLRLPSPSSPITIRSCIS